MRRRGLLMTVLLAFAAGPHPAGGWQVNTQETPLNEYLVAGVVVWAHVGSASIAVRGANLLGHLRIDVRTYRVKQPSTLLDLRPGDSIIAVYSRQDGMLHRLRRGRMADRPSRSLK
jgi:hypothetical protein